MINNKEIINNKSALFWTLDFAIDSNSELSGNDIETSCTNIIDIIKCLPITDNIICTYYEKYLNILNESKNTYININNLKDVPILTLDILRNADIKIENNIYFPCGWNGHCIYIFINKNKKNDLYTIGLINAGQGCDIQDVIIKDKCSGIIVNNKVSFDIANNYLLKYIEFYFNSKKNKNISTYYYIFYKEIYSIIYNTDDKYVYKINKQKTGSCTFTSIINYLLYMYISESKDSDENCIIEYNKWYNESSKLIANNITENYILNDMFGQFHKNIVDIYVKYYDCDENIIFKNYYKLFNKQNIIDLVNVNCSKRELVKICNNSDTRILDELINNIIELTFLLKNKQDDKSNIIMLLLNTINELNLTEYNIEFKNTIHYKIRLYRYKINIEKFILELYLYMDKNIDIDTFDYWYNNIPNFKSEDINNNEFVSCYILNLSIRLLNKYEIIKIHENSSLLPHMLLLKILFYNKSKVVQKNTILCENTNNSDYNIIENIGDYFIIYDKYSLINAHIVESELNKYSKYLPYNFINKILKKSNFIYKLIDNIDNSELLLIKNIFYGIYYVVDTELYSLFTLNNIDEIIDVSYLDIILLNTKENNIDIIINEKDKYIKSLCADISIYGNKYKNKFIDKYINKVNLDLIKQIGICELNNYDHDIIYKICLYKNKLIELLKNTTFEENIYLYSNLIIIAFYFIQFLKEDDELIDIFNKISYKDCIKAYMFLKDIEKIDDSYDNILLGTSIINNSKNSHKILLIYFLINKIGIDLFIIKNISLDNYSIQCSVNKDNIDTNNNIRLEMFNNVGNTLDMKNHYMIFNLENVSKYDIILIDKNYNNNQVNKLYLHESKIVVLCDYYYYYKIFINLMILESVHILLDYIFYLSSESPGYSEYKSMNGEITIKKRECISSETGENTYSCVILKVIDNINYIYINSREIIYTPIHLNFLKIYKKLLYCSDSINITVWNDNYVYIIYLNNYKIELKYISDTNKLYYNENILEIDNINYPYNSFIINENNKKQLLLLNNIQNYIKFQNNSRTFINNKTSVTDNEKQIDKDTVTIYTLLKYEIISDTNIVIESDINKLVIYIINLLINNKSKQVLLLLDKMYILVKNNKITDENIKLLYTVLNCTDSPYQKVIKFCFNNIFTNVKYYNIYIKNECELLKDYNKLLDNIHICENEYNIESKREILLINGDYDFSLIKNHSIKDNNCSLIIENKLDNAEYKIIYNEKIFKYTYCKVISKKEYIIKTQKQLILKFKDIMKLNIKNFNENIFSKALSITKDIFKLFINKKDKPLPIYELLMGSGKSSVIAPLLTLFLLNYMNSKKSDEKKYIIHCMPNHLINQSYKTFLKYVYPLFPTNIIIYNINRDTDSFGMKDKYEDELLKSVYLNKYTIILMDDLSLKSLILRAPDNYLVKESYIIYDEVDQMANPLTSELNFPYDINNLEHMEYIGTIIIEFYNKIYDNESSFWIEASNINSKNIGISSFHKYIKDYDLIKDVLNNKYDELCININKYFGLIDDIIKKKINEYIKINVLPIVITLIYTLNYGIPDVYDKEYTRLYKKKAIPYESLNTPSYGSEFSDQYLTLFLTFMSYKMGGIKRIDDQIELINIISNYDNIYKIDIYKKILKNVIINDKNQIIDYIKNNPDKVNNITDIDLIIAYFHKLSEELSKYNKYASNISFTELLMTNKVPDFVGFTGTPYIFLPNNIKGTCQYDNYTLNGKICKYKHNNIIYSNSTLLYKNIEYVTSSTDVINYCICKSENLYGVNSETLIDDTLNLLIKYEYNCLIDVAGIFIGQTQLQIIDQLRHKINIIKNYKYKYIVYFTDIHNVKNILTNEVYPLEDIKDINEYKYILFYFANDKITGIDIKKYMDKNAKGLCTISYNTRLRDISQGLFRMRDINNDQTCDFIINNDDLYLLDNKAECDIEQIIRTSRRKNYQYGGHNSKMYIKKLYNLFVHNEKKYNKNQYFKFIEQNMRGIYRQYGNNKNNSIINTIDPSKENINNIYDFLKKEDYYKDDILKNVYNHYTSLKSDAIIINISQSENISEELSLNNQIQLNIVLPNIDINTIELQFSKNQISTSNDKIVLYSTQYKDNVKNIETLDNINKNPLLYYYILDYIDVIHKSLLITAVEYDYFTKYLLDNTNTNLCYKICSLNRDVLYVSKNFINSIYTDQNEINIKVNIYHLPITPKESIILHISAFYFTLLAQYTTKDEINKIENIYNIIKEYIYNEIYTTETLIILSDKIAPIKTSIKLSDLQIKELEKQIVDINNYVDKCMKK